MQSVWFRRLKYTNKYFSCAVIPAQAGIKDIKFLSVITFLDSRLRGNDNREIL